VANPITTNRPGQQPGLFYAHTKIFWNSPQVNSISRPQAQAKPPDPVYIHTGTAETVYTSHYRHCDISGFRFALSYARTGGI
jgi:hypothetical protein